MIDRIEALIRDFGPGDGLPHTEFDKHARQLLPLMLEVVKVQAAHRPFCEGQECCVCGPLAEIDAYCAEHLPAGK